jgi:ribosomal protein S18 acetylase RimI-like enzyme
MPYLIRRAQPADRPALVRLMAELQEFERAMHDNRAPGALIADAHLAYLEQLVADTGGCMLVAEAGGASIGFLCAYVEASDEGDLHLREEERRYGVISDLFVVAEARVGGIGRALIAAAESHLWGQGVASVRITVLAANTAAQRAYERAGYRPYEITYERRRNAATTEE